jgi:hypothetical protein
MYPLFDLHVVTGVVIDVADYGGKRATPKFMYSMIIKALKYVQN